MNDHEKLIEEFATALWNALPYDYEHHTPVCPERFDAIRAVKEAIRKTRIRIESGKEFKVLGI